MSSRDLPARMARSAQSWLRTNPEYEYKFYDDGACLAFLEEYLPPRVVEAFKKCRVGAMKADLFRYAVLWVCGGVYADIDTVCLLPLGKFIPRDASYVTNLAHGHQRRSPQHQVIMIALGSELMRKCLETATAHILQGRGFRGSWGPLAGYAGPPVLDCCFRELLRPRLSRPTPRLIYRWAVPVGSYTLTPGFPVVVHGYKKLHGSLFDVKYSGYTRDLKRMGRRRWKHEARKGLLSRRKKGDGQRGREASTGKN